MVNKLSLTFINFEMYFVIMVQDHRIIQEYDKLSWLLTLNMF